MFSYAGLQMRAGGEATTGENDERMLSITTVLFGCGEEENTGPDAA